MVLGSGLFTPAYATPVLFTASTTLPATGTNAPSVALTLNDTAGTITAYGYDGVFSTANPPSNVNVNSPATSENVVVSNQGLGLASNDAPYIGPGDAVLLDFANVKTTDTSGGKTGTISQITFSLDVDATGPSDWVVYGMSNATGTGSGTLLASGPMSPTGDFMVSTSTLYSSYLIGVTNDCALTLNMVYVQYSGNTTPTPEPGTLVMAGMALLAVGLTKKLRSRKA